MLEYFFSEVWSFDSNLKNNVIHTKKHGQIDMQSEFLTHDFESMDITPKRHDDKNFKKEAKSK